MLVGWGGLLAASQGTAADPAGVEFFEQRIRPVLIEHCYGCHSAKAPKVKGGLTLDSRQNLLKGGDSGLAIVPGDVAKSRLIAAIKYTDIDLQMPPKSKLTDRQIAGRDIP